MLREEAHVGGTIGRGKPSFEGSHFRFQFLNALFAVSHSLLRFLDALVTLLQFLVGQGGCRHLLCAFFRFGWCSFCLTMVHVVSHARHACVFLFLRPQEVVNATDMLTHLSTTKFIHTAHESIEEITVVAHHNHRAIKLLHGILQHVLRLHVEVVGRFVENQEVHGFEQELNHRQTTAFTTRQHLHKLVAGFSTEHERTEQVANLQTNVSLCHTVDGVEHGDVAIEQLRLVLGKIADLHIVSHFQFAIVRNLVHDALHESGFTLTVVAHERHLLASLDGEVHIAKHLMLAISLAHFLANHGIVATAEARRKLQVQTACVNLIHFNQHHLLQSLHAALHLVRLRRFVSESLDEVLRLLYFLLLVLVGTQLLLASFVAKHHILVVLHLVVVDVSTSDFDGSVRHVVDKRTVVAHEHHGIRFRGNELLQPLNRTDVEVVGRLVEQ